MRVQHLEQDKVIVLQAVILRAITGTFFFELIK